MPCKDEMWFLKLTPGCDVDVHQYTHKCKDQTIEPVPNDKFIKAWSITHIWPYVKCPNQIRLI